MQTPPKNGGAAEIREDAWSANSCTATLHENQDSASIEGQRRLFFQFHGIGVAYPHGRQFVVIDGSRDD